MLIIIGRFEVGLWRNENGKIVFGTLTFEKYSDKSITVYSFWCFYLTIVKKEHYDSFKNKNKGLK